MHVKARPALTRAAGRCWTPGSAQIVGLCNVAIGFQRLFAGLLGVDPGQVSLDHVGLNHLTWERGASADGTDRLARPDRRARQRDRGAHRPGTRRYAWSWRGARPTTCAISMRMTR